MTAIHMFKRKIFFFLILIMFRKVIIKFSSIFTLINKKFHCLILFIVKFAIFEHLHNLILIWNCVSFDFDASNWLFDFWILFKLTFSSVISSFEEFESFVSEFFLSNSFWLFSILIVDQFCECFVFVLLLFNFCIQLFSNINNKKIILILLNFSALKKNSVNNLSISEFFMRVKLIQFFV